MKKARFIKETNKIFKEDHNEVVTEKTELVTTKHKRKKNQTKKGVNERKVVKAGEGIIKILLRKSGEGPGASNKNKMQWVEVLKMFKKGL